MRIAIISDIHGNLVSLEAVLADIESKQVDELICLGDVATLGPQPIEVVNRMMELDCQFIKGNHETDLLDIDDMKRRGKVVPIVMDTVQWCREQLSDQHLQFLDSFRPTLERNFDDVTALFFHGSPQANTDIILAKTPPDELDTVLNGHHATLFVGGHTHIPLFRRHHDMLIMNPGSVGEPLVQMPIQDDASILPWAEYAILQVAHGQAQVEFCRIPVDVDAIRQASQASTNPLNWAELWQSN